MSMLANEETLMTSNDQSITLSTHRIIQRSSQMSKEIFLKDLTSHEIIKKKTEGYYFVLATIFFITTTILLILRIQNESIFNQMDTEQKNLLTGFSLFLTILALYYATTSYEKILKISGKFSEIEIPIKDLSEQTLYKFTKCMFAESELRKKEE